MNDDNSTEATTGDAMTVPLDITVGGSLPSELFQKHSESTPEEQDTDVEGIVQQVLSALASQEDLYRIKSKKQEEIPNWLWKNLTSKGPQDGKPPKPETREYEWWMGTQMIHTLLPKLSSFEIQTVANQSIVFTEGSLTHGSLCILLCVYALQQCPSPIVNRWKRWQSLVCETIRMYQHYGVELVDLAVPLWIDHLVPACQHVIHQLPPEAYHVAFLAGLVGTTSTLVVRECRRPEKEDDVASSVLAHILQLLEAVKQIAGVGFDYPETWVWLQPWRLYSEKLLSSEKNESSEQSDQVELLQRQHEIAWWTESAYRHESVAGMDTAWDELGISLLALMAFDTRPLVIAPNFIWRVWFPHVLILFHATSDLPLLQHLPLSLLDNLLQVMPEMSLPPSQTNSKKPDSPLETFQQLSNRIMVYRADDDEEEDMNKQKLETQKNTDTIVNLMKLLLSRYQPVNQVKIIRKLVHDCPHPGLQAKFMDLLRAVIFLPGASEALWSYIGNFVKDLVGHIDMEKEVLIHVNRLVEKVEIYVGAITMIQLWCMVKSKLPKKIRGHSLRAFSKVLKIMLGRWMTDAMSMPPDDYYRLFLLDGALQQVLGILDEGRKKNLDSTSSDHSAESKSSVTEETADDDPIMNDMEGPPPAKVIFGEADLFL
jgi:hypothetical protein